MSIRRGLGLLIAALCVAASAMPIPGAIAAPSPTGTLTLVSARDHIPAAFLTEDSIYADRDRIYLAGTGDIRSGAPAGTLFVLARDVKRAFPVVQTITFDSGVTAVRGDRRYLYVATAGGLVHVYRLGKTLTPVASVSVGFWITTLDVVGSSIYVSPSGAAVAGDRVFLAQLNDGEYVQEILVDRWTLGRRYGTLYEPQVVIGFDRITGVQIGSLPWALDVFNRPALPNLYTDGWILVATAGGGCCSGGFDVYNAATMSPVEGNDTVYINTVTRSGPMLIAGLENGRVMSFPTAHPGAPALSAVDLRALTGHTGPEDIEIRALWTDRYDNLIFAGSSWGNDTSRSESLPSFFVLRLT